MFCCTRWIAKGEKFINLVISHTILSVATTWVWEIRIDRTQFSQWMCDIGLNVKGSVHYYYSPCVSNVITLNNYFLHTSERVTLPKTQGENFIRWSPCLGYWTSVRYFIVWKADFNFVNFVYTLCLIKSQYLIVLVLNLLYGHFVPRYEN